MRPVPFISACFLLVASHLLSAPRRTGLDEYVAAPDPSYTWKLSATLPGQQRTTYILEMTSQTWKEKDMNRGEWKHWLVITKPAAMKSDIGYLWITGGANDGQPRKAADLTLSAMADYTGAVVAELRMVPNQPLSFLADPARKPRVEDDFIAYTWNNYLKTGDESWPARMPMTKAAVRAMDTVTAFLATETGGNASVKRFVVSGASKRGWTTWTTAAVDSRVIAFQPVVIDLLNLVPSFIHHYRAYGHWAPAVGDYFNQGIMDRINDPKFTQLLKLVEPYHYRDRLKQPKFLVNAAGDQFFLPDSWKFYWKDLLGEKHLRYVPNADHSLRNSDAEQSLTVFFDSVVRGAARPEYSWRVTKDNAIEVNCRTKPESVKMWQATNPNARDFRLQTLGPAFTSSELQPAPGGKYIAKPTAPAKGYTAYFIEMTFPSGGRWPYKFTSGVVVTPDTYPYPAPIPGKTALGY